METTYYSIRGVVTGRGIREFGWWLWKRQEEYIQVRLNRNQLPKLNAAVSEMKVACGPTRFVHAIPRIIKVYGSEEEINYQIGASVGVTFAYADEMTQFHLGTLAFGIERMQLIKRGVRLENEV